MSRSNGTRNGRAIPNSPRMRRRRAVCRCGEPAAARGLCAFHYAKLRTYQHSQGAFESLYVSNEATLKHVAALRAAGLGWPRLAELTGLSRMTLDHITDPGRSMVMRRTERALRAVPVPVAHADALAPGAKISIVGSRRRLRALARAGYTQDDIARYLGIQPGMAALSKLVSGSQQLITARNARKIAAVFAELQLIPGPSEHAIREARRKGWPHPLEWDEDTIDEPAAVPHTPLRAAPRIERGRPVPPDFADIVAEHRELGRTDPDIAERIGIKLDTLQSRMRRLESRAS